MRFWQYYAQLNGIIPCTVCDRREREISFCHQGSRHLPEHTPIKNGGENQSPRADMMAYCGAETNITLKSANPSLVNAAVAVGTLFDCLMARVDWELRKEWTNKSGIRDVYKHYTLVRDLHLRCPICLGLSKKKDKPAKVTTTESKTSNGIFDTFIVVEGI